MPPVPRRQLTQARRQVQFVLIEQLLKPLEILGPKHLAQGADGEEKLLTRSNPLAAAISYRAADRPATQPVENAACRLKPPVLASTSSTSPAK